MGLLSTKSAFNVLCMAYVKDDFMMKSIPQQADDDVILIQSDGRNRIKVKIFIGLFVVAAILEV